MAEGAAESGKRPEAGSSFGQFVRLIGYALPYRKVIVLVVVFMAMYSVSNGMRLLLIEPMLKNFRKASQGQSRMSVWSRLTQRVLPPSTFEDKDAEPAEKGRDNVLSDATFNQLINLGLAFGAFSVLIGFSVSLREYFLRYLVNRAVTDIRFDLYGNLVRQDMKFYDNQRVGELISRVTNDIQSAQTILRSAVDDLIQEPFSLLALVFFAFVTSWQLSLFTFLIMPIILYPLLKFGGIVRKQAGKSLTKLADATEVMQQTFSGIKIVKAFVQEARERGRFAEANEGYFRKTMKVVRAKAVSRGLIEFFYNAGSGFLIVLGAALVLNGVWGLEMGVLLQYMMIVISMYQPLKTLSKAYNNVQEGFAGSTRVFALMDMKPEMKDDKDAVEMKPVREGVSFRNVGFSYGGSPVLSGVDLDVRAGEVVALVGESGAGKSTLLNLLARFYDVTEGSITIDGTDVRRIRRDSLRKHMAIVTQEPFLFNASVEENILYGKPDATRAEVEAAARAADILEFVQGELQGGFSALVGERGAKTSGGQRQRITIARALIRDPQILILDEATGALDSETESQVQKALNNLMKGRTTFVIAHRLSTIQHADRIVVLDRGRIVESGTHSELLARGGAYARLHERQFGTRESVE